MILIQVLLTILLALGCMAWVWILIACVQSRSILPRLGDIDLPAVERWPSITVIVPARDEMRALSTTCQSLLELDYPELEILLVDDRSEDGTGALIDRMAEREPRITSLHIGELPGGWLGKNRALHVAACQASGEWVLFTEADVQFEKGALRHAVRWALAASRDHVTLIPDVRARGFITSTIAAACTRMMFLGFRPWAVSDPDSDAYLGVGAFNLVRREVLQRTEGLDGIRLDFADDMALGRLMREKGARSGVAVAAGLVSVPGHRSLSALAGAFERRAYPLMGCSLPRLLGVGAGFGLLELAPWLSMVPSGIPMLRGLGCIATACLLATVAGMALYRDRPLGAALAAPIGTLLMLLLWIRAGIIGALAGGVYSRETFYPSDLLRRGATVVLPSWSSAPLVRLRALLTLPRNNEQRAWA